MYIVPHQTMAPIRSSSPTAPSRGLRSAAVVRLPAILRLLLLPLVLLLTIHSVIIGGADVVAYNDTHYARRLAACPVGTYSANGQDSPSACQQVAAGYYPSKTATISIPLLGDWYGITASPDFRYMAAILNNGNIYKSSDSGVTWTALTGAGSRSWRGIASTPDFTKLAATVFSDNIYFSVDSGAS
jgi:hypothetical protein